jgi:hypothetical protein
MLRYKLRTLMIVLALGPPLLAWWGWPIIDRIMPPLPDGELERRRVQSRLIRSMWGKCDQAASDAIYELGEIGDENAAKSLEAASKLPIFFGSKIDTAMFLSIEKIRKGNAAAKSVTLSDQPQHD